MIELVVTQGRFWPPIITAKLIRSNKNSLIFSYPDSRELCQTKGKNSNAYIAIHRRDAKYGEIINSEKIVIRRQQSEVLSFVNSHWLEKKQMTSDR